MPPSRNILDPNIIDFLTGWPAPELLPPKMLEVASHNALQVSDETTVILVYGEDKGYKPLRQEIAKWLTQFYAPKDPISHSRLCISGGASQNLACILQTFTDPVITRNVWMVAPTYYLACRIFTDAAFDGRLRAVPEDEEGIDLEYLRRGLEASEKEAASHGEIKPLKKQQPYRKFYRHVVYAIPSFANPTGRLMSLRRREGLVRLAREYDALVVTDDVYDMLQWPADPAKEGGYMDKAVLPRLIDIDRYLDGGPRDAFGNCISNGSFSKIVAPGCRTGWAEGTEAMAYGLSQTGSTKSGGAPSHLVAAFIHDMLVSGVLQKHIYEYLQPSYARRYHALVKVINSDLLPLGVTVPQANKEVAGGYFLWLRLPEPLKAVDIEKHALADEGVRVIVGARFQVDGDTENPLFAFERDIRLCYAWSKEDKLEEGIRKLAKVIKAAMPQDDDLSGSGVMVG